MTFSSSGTKEQFVREHPQYGYRGANANDTTELEIDRMRARDFAHMQGTNKCCYAPAPWLLCMVYADVCVCICCYQ